jgi:hypothetical protein
MAANVTLKLDESLIKQARKQALEEDCSLSGWVALLIQENLKQRTDYRSAKSRALQRMAKGFELSPGRLTREELHER